MCNNVYHFYTNIIDIVYCNYIHIPHVPTKRQNWNAICEAGHPSYLMVNQQFGGAVADHVFCHGVGGALARRGLRRNAEGIFVLNNYPQRTFVSYLYSFGGPCFRVWFENMKWDSMDMKIWKLKCWKWKEQRSDMLHRNIIEVTNESSARAMCYAIGIVLQNAQLRPCTILWDMVNFRPNFVNT